MPALSTSISVDGIYQVIEADAESIRGTIAWQKANAVFEPLGPAPTRAWLLMLRGDVLAMVNSKQGGTDSIGGNQPHFINWQTSLDGKVTKLTFHRMYFVQSERVFPGGPEDNNSLHLVEFCDARGICAKMTDSENTQVNVRSYADREDYLEGTEDGTWVSLLTTLWGKCPGLGAFPGLPNGFTPDGVPENARFLGVNAYHALCAILDKLDCAIGYSSISGQYEITQLGSDRRVIEPPADMLKWSSDAVQANVTVFPEKVRVYFNNHYQSYGQERDTEVDDNWSVSSNDPAAGRYIDTTTGINGAIAGTLVSMWDDLPRLLDENNESTNEEALEARALARMNGWVKRHKVARKHKVFIGLHGIGTDGQIRAALWRNWGDGKTNDLGGTVTEYICQAELAYGLGGGEGESSSRANFLRDTSHENYQPLDLGRHTYPNFPRLPNIVQVLHSPFTAGQAVEANEDGFHPGYVRRWVAGELATLEACWILFVDGWDVAGGDLTAIDGDIYGPARLSGVSTSGGTLRPVYTVRRGAIFSMIEFSLTGSLSGGTSSATILESWGTNASGTVTITDRRQLFRGARSGHEGIAVFDDSDGEWIPVECESKAEWVEATAANPMSGSSSSGATVNDYGGSQQDNRDPGGPITLNDTPGFFKRLLAGAKTYSKYDVVQDKYDLWMAQTMAGVAEVTLTTGFDGGEAMGTVDFYYGTQQDVLSPGSTITVTDESEKWVRTKAGAKCWVVLDADADKYRVIFCQQICIYAKAFLTENLCGETTASINDFAPMSPWPLDLSPEEAPTSVANPHFHRGKAGYEVTLFYDQDEEEWRIVDIDKTTVKIIVQIEGTGPMRLNSNKLQGYLVDAAIEVCGDPEWSDLIEGAPCDTGGGGGSEGDP